MSHIMKCLGVESLQEWEQLADERPHQHSDELIQARRYASNQMAAIFGNQGQGQPSEYRWLLTGQMTDEEHIAYLRAKYTSSHQ